MHRTVLESNDLALDQTQSSQSIDLGRGGKLERGRHGCRSTFHGEREQAKGDVRSGLLHLFLERAHALGIDAAFDGTARDERAESDAARDQALERELRERL